MCRAAVAMTRLEKKGSLLISAAHQSLPRSNHSAISGQNLKISFEKEWSLCSDPGLLLAGWEEYLRLKMKLAQILNFSE